MKAVLFDLDGTLVDAAPWHRKALDDALAEHGYDRVSPHRDLAERLEGLPTRVKLDTLVTSGHIRATDIASIAALKQRKTREVMEKKLRFDPEKFCLLWGLRTAGYKVGVVTNCVRETAALVLRVLINTDVVLSVPVGVLVTNEDCAPKPSPEPYLRAAKRLGLDPADCLAVEDNGKGVESATKAGCKVLRVASPVGVTAKAVWATLEGK